MFVAFGFAIRHASGSDRVRIYWAAGSICVGFIGPIAQTIIIVYFHDATTLDGLLSLTLVAVPIGLAYTILRHRTVDIGFVISRALVLTILSFVLVAAFGLLERALGKIFIDASHVASRSVEIALALGLGFSLRPLHARIEQFVDSIFFRARRRALAELKAFGSDVYHITDPRTAIERTVNVVGVCTGAENAALYVAAGGVFECAAAIDAALLPAELDENDPLFVRLRAARKTELLRGTGSAIDAEIAFPMFVRGTLAGAVVLAAKRSGEAYDPEETALLSDLVQRAGLALDALQTLALPARTRCARCRALSGSVMPECNRLGSARRSSELKTMAHFDKNLTVEQAFKTHAGARRVFARFHLGGCSNCAISETETIEQVSEGLRHPAQRADGRSREAVRSAVARSGRCGPAAGRDPLEDSAARHRPRSR